MFIKEINVHISKLFIAKGAIWCPFRIYNGLVILSVEGLKKVKIIFGMSNLIHYLCITKKARNIRLKF